MRTKKILAAMLALVMVVVMIPVVGVSAATEGYYTYVISNGFATIIDVDTSIRGDVVIPETLGGYPVMGIGYTDFTDYEPFAECVHITSVTIPDTVTRIGNYAFRDCTGLLNVYLPSGLKIIGKWAFLRCTGLSEINIPDGVTTIDYAAFSACSGLKSIDFPDSVTTFGYGLIAGCTSLETLEIPYIKSVNSPYTYEHLGALFGGRPADGNASVLESLKKVVITKATSIGKNAFLDCKNITSVAIPDTVTMIDDGAFMNCTNLVDVLYAGSSDDWKKIEIGNSNMGLINVERLHYNVSDPDNHYVCNITKEASCTSPGNSVYECSCGYSKEVITPEYGHSYENGVCTQCGVAENPPSTPGDASGDGSINLSDVSLVLQHIAKWDVTLDTDAADVTANDKVNLSDVSLLLQYIANWDVELK